MCPRKPATVSILDFRKIIGLTNCSLAIQFWNLYVLAEQTNKSVAEIWDGENLKISFRRRVFPRLMRMWLDIVSIAESISYTDDCDAIIWAFDGSARFSM